MQATNWFGADLAKTCYFGAETLLTNFWFPDTLRCKDILVSFFRTAAKISNYIVLLAINKMLRATCDVFYTRTTPSFTNTLRYLRATLYFSFFSFRRSKALAFWHRKTLWSPPEVFLSAITDRKRSPCASCNDHMHPRNIVPRSDGGRRRGNQELLLGQFTWSPHEREVANPGRVRQYETASLLSSPCARGEVHGSS